jgi:hypothetical protein
MAAASIEAWFSAAKASVKQRALYVYEAKKGSRKIQIIEHFQKLIL